MTLLLVAVVVLLASGILSLITTKYSRFCSALGAGGAVAGAILGLIPLFQVLGGGPVQSLYRRWQVPFGSFAIELDSLSAFFLVPILGLTALAAIYGSQYLQAYAARKSLGASWCFYNLLTASMMLVIVARNGILFLIAWEVMSLASYFLVTFEDEKESVCQAGWTYLVATHLGTAFLLALFILLGQPANTLDFSGFDTNRSLPATQTSLLFLLAVVGFGTKAGFMPLHVWLPEAHPAAPSHVSAVMSGVMIKTGIYGLLRVLTFLGPPPEWWGWLLIAIGLASGVFGILFALAQHDLKRLLAYSSVENIGIITLGLGLGLLGLSTHNDIVAVLGFAGGLLHVINHALFKGLLFLGAGAVLHATHTGQLDELGGLLKRMPWTAATFLTGAVAVSGLPPLNGFISEFVIYLGAFDELWPIQEPKTMDAVHSLAPLAVIAGLAAIGGLSTACFAKAFGIVFLGEPRTEHARHARRPGPLMRWPMLLLTAGCVAVGVFAPLLLALLGPVVANASGIEPEIARGLVIVHASAMLGRIVMAAGGLVALIAALAWLRGMLLRTRLVTEAVTWDCGYARPAPRMQYTASSFSQPFTELFRHVLRTKKTPPMLTDYFPKDATLVTETPEPWRESVYQPVFRGLGWTFGKLRWLQHGRVQLYVMYIALTMLVLLVWYLGWST
jgi:formate hydrogenlyase subunit 3/multisubunit Na+/H+ antiporter MnhD subunit